VSWPVESSFEITNLLLLVQVLGRMVDGFVFTDQAELLDPATGDPLE
jgi:hypothetical protein